VTVAVAAVAGLIHASEAVVLVVALPVAALGLVVVLGFMLKLTGEGDQPDPDAAA
jgi:hypothetical protein